MQIGFGQRLIYTRLIGAERAAALKQQRDLFERCAPLRHGKPPVPAALRRNKPTALTPPLASRRRRWTQPALKGTVGLLAPIFCRQAFAETGTVDLRVLLPVDKQIHKPRAETAVGLLSNRLPRDLVFTDRIERK